MKYRISRLLLDRFAAEARSSGEQEICGILVGETGRIIDGVAVSNVHADPKSGFALDSDALLRASRRARERGLRIVGHYHSHPSGDPRPSVLDARNAVEGNILWLIVTEADQMLWNSRRGGAVKAAFDPVQMVVETTVLQPRRTDANRGRGMANCTTGALTA